MARPNLADLKAHLNISSSTNDDELADILDAAIELVENIVGPLEADGVTEIHSRVSSDVLVLRSMPAADLTSISFRAGLSTTPLTLSDFELDSTAGIVRVVTGSGFYGDYVVEYTAGFDTLPASVRLATLIIAAHLWETQRGMSPSALALQPDVDQAVPQGVGYAIPSRAEALLEPYRLTLVH